MFQNQLSITRTWTPFCSYCQLLSANVKKKYWKNIICEYRRTKRVRITGFWDYFWTISTRSKKQISSKIYIYIKYICLAFNWQRQNDFIKAFKVMVFINWQQETKKGTLKSCKSEPLKTLKSSHLQIFFKIGSSKNFAIFTGKHLCGDSFFIKLQV